MAESLIGAGIGFPLRLDPAGSFALVTRERELEEAIYLILATVPGERPMRPEFGCGIHDYVFAPSDADTAGRLAFEVRNALERWEPRVEVVDVVVTPSIVEGSGCLMIDVRYAIAGSNDARNLVFPFYVIPEETP
jgi:phage baseplate assembly protein W